MLLSPLEITCSSPIMPKDNRDICQRNHLSSSAVMNEAYQILFVAVEAPVS
jgi:hypothetical protein